METRCSHFRPGVNLNPIKKTALSFKSAAHLFSTTNYPLNYLFAYQSDCPENRVEDKALDCSYHHRPCPQHPFFFLPRPSLSRSESSFLQIRWVVPHRAIRRLVSSEHPPTCRKHCTPLIIASRRPSFIFFCQTWQRMEILSRCLFHHLLLVKSIVWIVVRAFEHLTIWAFEHHSGPGCFVLSSNKVWDGFMERKNFLRRRLNWNDETYSFVFRKMF